MGREGGARGAYCLNRRCNFEDLRYFWCERTMEIGGGWFQFSLDNRKLMMFGVAATLRGPFVLPRGSRRLLGPHQATMAAQS